MSASEAGQIGINRTRPLPEEPRVELVLASRPRTCLAMYCALIGNPLSFQSTFNREQTSLGPKMALLLLLFDKFLKWNYFNDV